MYRRLLPHNATERDFHISPEGECMTVKSDLQKALALCESMRGNYTLMADSTEDKPAKLLFNTLKKDLEKHIEFLTDRVDYLTLSQNVEL